MSLRVIVYDDAVTSAVVILNLIQDPVFVKKIATSLCFLQWRY